MVSEGENHGENLASKKLDMICQVAPAMQDLHGEATWIKDLAIREKAGFLGETDNWGRFL